MQKARETKTGCQELGAFESEGSVLGNADGCSEIEGSDDSLLILGSLLVT